MRKIDLRFRVFGSSIPADHGYALYSALSKIAPVLHEATDIGIHPINGMLGGKRNLLLTERSRLAIRVPCEKVHGLLPISGKRIDLNGSAIRIGVPDSMALKPSPRLYSRMVVLKGYMEPEGFLAAVNNALSSLGAKGIPSLIEQRAYVERNEGARSGTHSEYLRRTINIKGKEIVGFAVLVDGLSALDSILLQEEGLGGRRKFGCGIFLPALPRHWGS